ncbi:MAG: hypothetical protein V1729_04290 [Candidatus Woesearchaeota archaeon]
MATKNDQDMKEKLDKLGILPEPDPDKPIQPTRKGPQKLHHHLDHKIVLPMVIMIVALSVSMGLYAYFSPPELFPEEVGIEASAGPAPPSTANVLGSAGAVPIVDTGELPGYCKEFVTDGRYTDQDSCFADLAMVNANDGYCYGIRSLSIRNACFSEIADVYLNSDACLALDSWESCLMGVALGSSDPEPCFNIFTQKGDISVHACLTLLAKQENDAELCTFIEDGIAPYDSASCTKGAQETI